MKRYKKYDMQDKDLVDLYLTGEQIIKLVEEIRLTAEHYVNYTNNEIEGVIFAFRIVINDEMYNSYQDGLPCIEGMCINFSGLLCNKNEIDNMEV